MRLDSSSLLNWYDTNRRDLPWRRTRDPYAIWVSEIMLQQTQVATVVPYFQRWMARFPTVGSLAEAGEQEALSVWQGLGYYRRCRMLQAGARWVTQHGWPAGYSEWLNVPGVGRYTAAAIASIAGGERVAVVDGNVQRVFARQTASELAGANLQRAAWKWAEASFPAERPGDWNQALMELGATICRPREPLCVSCPIAGECEAFRLGSQNQLPRQTPKPKTVRLVREAWVHRCDGRFGLEQIPRGEWWEGMWRFPPNPHPPLEGIGVELSPRDASVPQLPQPFFDIPDKVLRLKSGPDGGWALTLTPMSLEGRAAEECPDATKPMQVARAHRKSGSRGRLNPNTLGLSKSRIGLVNHTVTNHRIAMAVHVVDCAKPIESLAWFTPEELGLLPLPAPYRRALQLAAAAVADLANPPRTLRETNLLPAE